MRKFKIYAFVAAMMAATSLTSCSLDIEPTTSVPSETINDPKSQINGLYNLMQGVSYYGRTFPLLADVGTDLVVRKANSGRFQLDHEMSKDAYNATGVSDDYDNANTYQRIFKVIVNANLAISNPKVTGDLRGQAYFLRALAYADMARMFGSVPVVVLAPGELPPPQNFNPAKNTTEEVYAQVMKDLDEAAKHITNTKSKRYASVDAVKALRARVQLQRTELLTPGSADYTAAMEAVVTNVDALASYTFVGSDKPEALYEYFQGDNGSETIFELKFTADQGRGANNFAHLYHKEGYGDYIANPMLAASIDANDVRKHLFLVPVVDGTPQIGLNYVRKFDKHEEQVGMHSPKLLRYAEALLNKAEALVALNRGAEAAAILNQIATVRAIDKTKVVTLTTATIDNVLDARAKELAFEGFRVFDLRRNKKSVTLYALKGDLTTEATVRKTVAAGDKQFWYPIPQDEILTNPNMTQNHGY